MKHSTTIVAIAISIIFLLQAEIVDAAEVKILSALGVKEVMNDLAPKFERATGHKLVIAFANVGAIVKRVQDGETADLIVVPRQGIDRFVRDGKTSADNVTVLARGGLGVAVRKGAPKPDISPQEALNRALLAAKSITYLDPAGGGVSGVHVAKVLDRMGIANDVRAKIILHRNADAAGVMIVNGEAEIGINLIQEFMPMAGVDLVGPLPGDLQLTIVYSAAIMTGAKEPAASKALVDFLRTPEAASVIKAKGMEPG